VGIAESILEVEGASLKDHVFSVGVAFAQVDTIYAPPPPPGLFAVGRGDGFEAPYAVEKA